MSILKRLLLSACVFYAAFSLVQSVSMRPFERFDSNTFNRLEANAIQKTANVFGEPERAFQFKDGASYLLGKGISVNKAVFSVSLWVRFSELDRHNVLMFIEGDEIKSRFFFLSTFTPDEQHKGLHIGTVFPNHKWGRAYAGNDSLFTTNTWYHVVGVVNTRVGNIKCYLDNKLIIDIPVNKGEIPLSATRLWIGSSPEDNRLNLQGEISDIHIFDGELSAGQVHALHQGKDVERSNHRLVAYLMAVGLAGAVFVLYSRILSVLNGIYTHHKTGILLISSIVALTSGFYNNFWNTAGSEEFGYFQKDSESLVVGRLALAKRQGVLSQGGFLCRIEPHFPENSTAKQLSELFAQRLAKQYSVYLDSIDTGIYTNYPSQTGFQGMCFAAIDKLLNFKPKNTLAILYLLTSVMSAIAISLIIYWVYIQIGFMQSIIVLLMLVCGPSLTLFGRNLYWVIWAFYIPFITSLFLLHWQRKRKITAIQIVAWTFVSVVIKCLFTGYEYISAVVIMLTTPYFFYAVLHKWQWTTLVSRLLVVAVSALSAVLFVVTIHLSQISAHMPSVNGLHYMIGRFIKRTLSTTYVDERFEPGFNYDRVSIIGKYLNHKALSFSNEYDFFPFAITFGQLIWIFLICSVLVFISEKYSPSIAQNRRKHLAMIGFVWVSLLAPFSWFIIFKQHAYVHIHMDHIVWYMPFVIIGFAMCASVGCDLGADVLQRVKKRHWFSSSIPIRRG